MSPGDEIKHKRVHLDVCALCRPFDDQRQVRIQLEAGCVELILSHARGGSRELIVSPAHDREIAGIDDVEERSQLVLALGELGKRHAFDLPAARKRTEDLMAVGLGAADASHVAFSEQAGAEFVSVDDRLLRRCQQAGVAVWCGTPLAYCDKESLR